MKSIIANSLVKEASIEAVIIRADGTREVLGTVGYYHRNPIKRFIWKVKQWLRCL